MSRKEDREGDGTERAEVLKRAIAAIEKQFGKGTVMTLGGDDVPGLEENAIPTGSPSLDRALGIGGYPRGRIVEIFGPESSGKTTLALHAIASAQARGGTAAFIDAEHAFDVSYARAVGVDVRELLVSQPDCGEQALDIAETLVRSGVVDVIVVDSVAALVPRAEIEGEMGDQHMGLQARLMSQALRKLTAVVHRNAAVLVFINQIRMKIGVVFGSPETTTGGNALKFYSSVRLEIRRSATIKSGETIIGNQARVKVVKNKVAPPFREAHIEIRFGRGIFAEAELLELGVESGSIEKAGAWYAVDGERIGQGRDAALEYLAANPALCSRIRDASLRKAAA